MKNNSGSLSCLNYRADIDGLRAIAVLSVVGFHAFPKLFRGGFIGVDVFFVISGFLISSILIESLQQGTFSFRRFYAKRIKRIFPALLSVLVFSIIFGWFILFPQEYTQLGKHIAGGASFISNFLLWQESGYFDHAAEAKPLLHLWSLGIEEQFYIIWPLLLWALWKKRFNPLMSISAIALLSFILNIKILGSDRVAAFYSPQTRFWELLCGSLLAVYQQNLSVKINKKLSNTINFKMNDFTLSHFFSFLGFLLIAYGVYQLTKDNFPGLWALLPTLGAVLLILAGTEGWVNRIILSNPILIWFGLISYPLYLWHWPLLVFARIIEDQKPNTKIRMGAVVISILLAWLTYKLIEKPIRHNLEFLKMKTALLIIAMFFVGYLGFYIYEQHGFNFRFKNLKELNSLITLIDHPYPSVKSFTCANLIPELKKFSFDGGCLLSKESAPNIMFIGDSHAQHYFNAVWKYFPNDAVLMVVQTSCLPFASNEFLKGECKEKYDAIIAYIQANSALKKIYLSGYWAYLMTGGFDKKGEHWRQTKAIDPRGAKSFIENGMYFLNQVLKTNKEIIFLKDIPDLDFNIKSCFKIRPFQLSYKPRNACWIDFGSYLRRVADYDKVVNELLAKFPQVKIYDPRPLFCNKKKCVASDNKLPYYFNGDHLNHFGANFVIKDMLEKLA